MALILENVTVGNDIKNLSYLFKEGFITALDGSNCQYLLDALIDNKSYVGTIQNESKEDNQAIIHIRNDDFLYTVKVKDEFKLANEYYKIDKAEISNRVDKYLSLFGLDATFLERLVYTLSKTETYIVNIIKSLIADYNVVIFDRVFSSFDYKYSKILKQLINNLKLTGKIVILCDDINIAYILANDILILNEDGTSSSGSIKELCTDVKLLESLQVKPPILTLITYRAKTRKNINISYHKDVRDLIKDIYKHV